MNFFLIRCKFILHLLVICCKYIVHLLIICCKYIVHLLVIFCEYIVPLLVILCKFIVHLLVICCKYIVHLLVVYCKFLHYVSLDLNAYDFQAKSRIVKCLAEFYGSPVPSTLSVAHILISSSFSQTQSIPSPYVSQQFKKCEALYCGKYSTFHFAFIDRTSKYFAGINGLYGNLKYIFFFARHVLCFCVWAV